MTLGEFRSIIREITVLDAADDDTVMLSLDFANEPSIEITGVDQEMVTLIRTAYVDRAEVVVGLLGRGLFTIDGKEVRRADTRRA